MEQRKMFWVCGPLTAIALALGASPTQADIVCGNVNPVLQARLGRPGS